MAAFNGSWALDSAKSESTDKLLSAQGVGWAKRQVMNNLSQTMTINVAGDQLTIKQETSVSTTEFTVTLGAAPVEFDDELSGKKAQRSAKLEGDNLIVIADGPDGILTVTRTVEGGNVLKAVIVYKLKKDNSETTCTRFFNRK